MALLKGYFPPAVGLVAGVTMCVAIIVGAEPKVTSPNKQDDTQTVEEPSAVAEPFAADSVEAARKQATLMHSIYLATLEVVHRHYFHENKSILPARAMEDVFADLSRQSKLKSNWIAVNTKAMSVHHEPKSDLEIKAAAELRAGKEAYEIVEKGFYYRAAPIALGASCVNCHTNFSGTIPRGPLMAGLIIGIPVEED